MIVESINRQEISPAFRKVLSVKFHNNFCNISELINRTEKALKENGEFILDYRILQKESIEKRKELNEYKIDIFLICNCDAYIVKNILLYEAELEEDAKIIDYFSRFSIGPIPITQESSPLLPSSSTNDEFFDEIFSNDSFKFLIIAEKHTEKASHQFFKKYKNKLAANGYEILASEFYSIQQQPALDAYHYGNTDQLPKIFSLNIAAGCPSRTGVIKQLQSVGIRTIAIEDAFIRDTQGLERISKLDDATYCAIEREVTRPLRKNRIISSNPIKKGKVIIWVGGAHAKGIANRLGKSKCAMIAITNSNAPLYQGCTLQQIQFNDEDSAALNM